MKNIKITIEIDGKKVIEDYPTNIEYDYRIIKGRSTKTITYSTPNIVELMNKSLEIKI